jgi:hypothetical protein
VKREDKKGGKVFEEIPNNTNREILSANNDSSSIIIFFPTALEFPES